MPFRGFLGQHGSLRSLWGPVASRLGVTGGSHSPPGREREKRKHHGRGWEQSQVGSLTASGNAWIQPRLIPNICTWTHSLSPAAASFHVSCFKLLPLATLGSDRASPLWWRPSLLERFVLSTEGASPPEQPLVHMCLLQLPNHRWSRPRLSPRLP